MIDEQAPLSEQEIAEGNWLMFVHADTFKELQDSIDAYTKRERSGMPFYPLPLINRLIAGL